MVLVGTREGLFTFESDVARREWRRTGPFLAEWEVTGLLGDSRHGHRIFAGTSGDASEPAIRVSEDFGQTWTPLPHSPRYAADSGRVVRCVWQIVPGHPSAPDTYLAGVDEAGLFLSLDRGATWHHRDTLASHPTRPQWSRTKAGNPLHSLIVHPDRPERLWGLVGGAGVAYSDDGGVEWEFRNAGLPPAAGAPALTQGVHRLAADPADPERLYLQHTGGTFASEDGGRSWRPIGAGLPSRFGFALEAAPDGTVYTIPLDAETRCFPRGRVQVYRRGRGAEVWQALAPAEPGEPRAAGVLRDAFAVDGFTPSGLHLGTTQGDLFVSPDGGATWSRLAAELPRIQTVRVWQLD